MSEGNLLGRYSTQLTGVPIVTELTTVPSLYPLPAVPPDRKSIATTKDGVTASSVVISSLLKGKP